MARSVIVNPNNPKPVPAHEIKVTKRISAEIKVLDADEFIDYINYSGSWDSGGSGLIKNHDSLANLIDQLIVATTDSNEMFPIVPVPLVPLRLSLIGKQYSGKKSIASFLAQTYNMSIIDIDSLVKEPSLVSDSNQKKKTNQPDGKDGKRPQMIKGQAMDDVSIVQLVVDVLNQEPECPGGWIILDFPKTKLQAYLFEKEFSGYEDPKPLKKGDPKKMAPLKEKSIGSSVNPNLRNRTVVLPHDSIQHLEAQMISPLSGFDAVFLLESSDETCFKRMNEQRENDEGKLISSSTVSNICHFIL